MKKINDVFTVTRDVNFSVGENCFLAHLEGGLILLGEDVVNNHPGKCGATEQKVFTFKCVSAGKAAYQFAVINSPGGPLLFEEILPVEIAANATNSMVGGWSPAVPIKEDPAALKVFNEAMKGLMGVDYTPVSVSKQVVNGMNYRFLCSAKAVVPNPEEYHAEVYIYQAPGAGKKTIVTKIVPITKK